MSGGGKEAQAAELVRVLFDLVRKESCGECFPCALGTRQIGAALDGKGAAGALLQEIGRAMKRSSKCGVGRIGGALVLELLDRYPAAFKTGA
ncbi:MAG: NADH-ubiquinone oxidoreductase-F iron-sulfur binding region domain-containing protein [Bacillota bacterium]